MVPEGGRSRLERESGDLLIFTPYHPKKNLDKTICLRPNFGPKVEKKQTGIMPKILKKKIVRIVSINPR
jgi:hypothetical protein